MAFFESRDSAKQAVIPAKAGIQSIVISGRYEVLGPSLRWDDD